MEQFTDSLKLINNVFEHFLNKITKKITKNWESKRKFWESNIGKFRSNTKDYYRDYNTEITTETTTEEKEKVVSDDTTKKSSQVS